MFGNREQNEPTAILFSARQGGKSQALIDSMLAQANERGIRVEVVYPQSERSPEFDSLEQELFKHQPVLSMRDGSIAGCQCLDRVFHKDAEDWGTHLAEVFESLHPAQTEPTEAQVDAGAQVIFANYKEGYRAWEGADFIARNWARRTFRAALKAAFTAGQEEKS